jgi:hypothetical protein
MPPGQEITPRSPVYHLPDFVFFRHSRHASNGLTCVKCHGDVWAQSQVQPVLAMKMVSCVGCHQAMKAPVTCTTCHELSQ